MKKSFRKILKYLLITISIVCLSSCGDSKPLDGDGTELNPYLLKTKKDFSKLNNYYFEEGAPSYFKVCNDIEVGEEQIVDNFKGILDGNGYSITIKSFTKKNEAFGGQNLSKSVYGLFRNVNNSKFLNINFILSLNDKNTNIYGSSKKPFINGIIGEASESSFEYVTVNNDLEFNTGFVVSDLIFGSLVGMYTISSSNSENQGFIACSNNSNLYIRSTECNFTSVGGLVGLIHDNTSSSDNFSLNFTACTNGGDIKINQGLIDLFSTRIAGGIVGSFGQSSSSLDTRVSFNGCSNTGKLVAKKIGDICGGITNEY